MAKMFRLREPCYFCACACLLGTTLLLAGCGSGPAPAPAETPTAAPTSVPTSAPTPAPPPAPGPMKQCPETFQRGQCSSCVYEDDKVQCKACRDPYKLKDGACAFECPSKPPERLPLPQNAQTYNGKEWPTMCIDSAEAHFFTIGDWGGVCNFDDNVCKPGQKPAPLQDPNGRARSEPFDSTAQTLVSQQMAARAEKSRPHFVINVGDNFYPGGIDDHCGSQASALVPTSKQFTQIFEEMYTGSALQGKEWWGVLGNHDYGGVCFITAWDQQIYYTWGTHGRWLVPAQYWYRRAQFRDFTADFYFVDSNYEDTFPPNEVQEHNICGQKGNTDKDWYCGKHAIARGPEGQCAVTGPHTPDDCVSWFKKLNDDQKMWLEDLLKKSTAEWQIVVTHFPPRFNRNGLWWQVMSSKYGIDLIITGHTHYQEVYYMGTSPEVAGYNLGATAWVVTGGGGGITSERTPTATGHDNAYGFMDMTISKDHILIESISHGGILRNSTLVKPRRRVVPMPSEIVV